MYKTDHLTDRGLIELLRSGAVGVLPTDTLYGLVCLAADQAAVERLYGLKQREQKPGTLIAANIEQLETLGFKRRYLTAVERFWPAPLSVIIPCGDELEYIHQGLHSIAVRLPAAEPLQKLLLQTGPLLTSSANPPADQPATSVVEAEKYFADQVDFYVDGGDLYGRKPSTIIQIIDDAIQVIRSGAVTIDENGRVS
jgi:L-threonylcarbamoyladenylate synthase